MKVELIKQEGTKVSFKLTVDNEKFESAIVKAYNKNKGKYNIPGFRKGKAPRKVIETHYGKGVFYSDAIDIVFPEVYPAAIDELKIDPIDMPSIDVEEISKDNGLVLLVDVEVKPEFQLGDYKGVEVEKVDETVNEDVVNAKLDEMREKGSRLVSVEREIANGDTANIDFEGFDGEVAFEGGKGENYDLVIGSGSFIPGFEDQLVGKKAGEEVEVNVTFPEEYHAENLAGKPVVFKVKVNDVKVKELPELNDEFAADTTEFNTLEELRADVRAKAEADAKEAAKNELRNRVIEKVVANTEVEVPEAMIKHEIENQMMELNYQLQYQGFGMEQFLKMTGKTMEEFKAEFAASRREEALRNVKTSLVIEAIAKAEGVEVNEEEVNAEVQKMADAYNMTVEQVKGALRATDLKDMEGQLKIRKTIDLLVENAKIA
ncbi:MAG: trigger factor [Clostridiales bacterium]|uniref:trigger factor n=1 Tax=Terrisporobacter sp. TaxID=1965305 RepID=UPI002A565B72|nr:trigger factor [Terrisporobacter sp.]MCI6459088.1 trigger factor [Clostridium sp.]MDD7757624.1 trigger factor [Clostridiales bacterium]MDY4133753.1 trigger factor [Terrisporobacter sp.]MDY4735526.1 trigger factor [Terrisporobacter sp.]MDY6152401.1 trigger factor [Terrisporobacter sp.]